MIAMTMNVTRTTSATNSKISRSCCGCCWTTGMMMTAMSSMILSCYYSG